MLQNGRICNLNNAIIKRLEDIGAARLLVKQLLDKEIFESTSKHNPYWDSEHEVESDKLDEARRTLIGVQMELWEIQEMLASPEEEGLYQ